MAIYKYPTGGTYELTLTAGGSANTKGSYTEIVASTGEEARGVFLAIISGSASGQKYLVDLAVGGAGAEVVVVANVPFANGTAGNTNCPGIFIPVAIASGARLSARVQCSSGGASCNIALHVIGGTTSASVATYGAATASSTGTTVDPGAVANTKGAYVEVAAATSDDFDWIVVVITGLGNPLPSSAAFQFDLATGAAGAEVVEVPDVIFTVASSPDTFLPNVWQFPLSISAGTRLAARAQSSTTDATDRLFSVTVFGITDSGLNGGGGGGTTYRPVIGGGLGYRGIGVS